MNKDKISIGETVFAITSGLVFWTIVGAGIWTLIKFAFRKLQGGGESDDSSFGR